MHQRTKSNRPVASHREWVEQPARVLSRAPPQATSRTAVWSGHRGSHAILGMRFWQRRLPREQPTKQPQIATASLSRTLVGHKLRADWTASCLVQCLDLGCVLEPALLGCLATGSFQCLVALPAPDPARSRLRHCCISRRHDSLVARLEAGHSPFPRRGSTLHRRGPCRALVAAGREVGCLRRHSRIRRSVRNKTNCSGGQPPGPCRTGAVCWRNARGRVPDRRPSECNVSCGGHARRDPHGQTTGGRADPPGGRVRGVTSGAEHASTCLTGAWRKRRQGGSFGAGSIGRHRGGKPLS